MKILVINPGSTSTKIGIFENNAIAVEQTLRHDTEELAGYQKITEQYSFRMQIIEDFLKNSDIDIFAISAIVGMGGLLLPLLGGTYQVNETMLKHLNDGIMGEHASNLGGIIAYAIGQKIDKPAFIVDPVVVDEFEPIARISGHPKIERKSIFHALNQKAIARKYCQEINKNYNKANLIVVHMGGGISVSIHSMGRVVDSNNALDGDGPFTPERTGGLPVGDLAKLCYSNISLDHIKGMIKGNGGMVAYFGTNNMKELEEKAKTESQVKLTINAMAYQIAKEIGAMATVVYGKLDGILLTGGIAYSQLITSDIKCRVEHLGNVKVYPGEDELSALAQGAARVLKGEEAARIYPNT